MIIGREHGPVKPDAFGVEHICRSFAVLPEQAAVVGDYVFDLQCARSAGASAILLASHERANEFAAEADFVIEKLGQLLHIIEMKNNRGQRI